MRALAVVLLLSACAAPTGPGSAVYTDDEIIAIQKHAFQAGYWAGWKNANREAGRGL